MMNMMKIKLYILLGVVMIGLSACQSDEPLINLDEALVTLNAQVEDQADTRTAFVKVNSSLPYPFDVAVWASTTSNDYTVTGYDGTDKMHVGKHVTATFNQASTTLPGPSNSGIRYPITDGVTPTYPTVYFTGLYPSTGWATTTGTSAVYNSTTGITGKEDLMYAPEVFGNGNVETAAPTLTFYHLLTYLRFKFVAVSTDAQIAWGKITSIKLIKQENGNSFPKNLVDLTLGTTAPTISNVTLSSNVTELPLYIKRENTIFPSENYTIPTVATEEAYILCSPVNASNASNYYEYTLEIETEKRNTTNTNSVLLGVDLKGSSGSLFSGSTMGKMFTVTLTFTLNSIAASASITQWDTAGIGKEDVSE